MIDKQIDKWQTEYSLIFEELEEEGLVLNALLKDQMPPLSGLEEIEKATS